MREGPPPTLVDLLGRLELAAADQIGRVAGRVRRLARDLPLFESVWVDALAQARVLTPFQAAEINAGRGDGLRAGPYLLCQPLPSPAYAVCYVARETGSGRLVRLALVSTTGGAPALAGQLEKLAAASGRLETELLAPLTAAGADGNRLWAVCRHVVGLTAGEWMIHNGRFPPEAVLEIARRMLVGLVTLEKENVCHGDIGASGVILARDGGVVLPFPGLRGILRPEEAYAHADLLPEGYDYLAPERVTRGTPPTVSSDIYACGCLWWHLLAGRPPVPGGSSLAKLQAAQTVEIPDVRQLAPDTPAPLAAAISSSVEREPQQRPESMAQLAAMLGPPRGSGRVALAQCVARPGSHRPRWPVSVRSLRESKQTPLWLVAIGGCLVAAVTIAWSIWQAGLPKLGGGSQMEKHEAIRQSAPGESRPTRQDVSAGAKQDQTGDAGPSAAGAAPGRPQPPASDTASGDEAPDARFPGDTTPGKNTNELVLPTHAPVAAESLQLRPGLCVRGGPGARPVVLVPAAGLVIRPEDVRFENCDFLGDGPAASDRSGVEEPAIIQLQASRAEFRGCSFQAAKPSSAAPLAIRWVNPVERGPSDLALPNGRIQLSDCVFRDVRVALACRTLGAVAVEVTNALHLGSGALVQLDHCPRADEPVSISLSGLTLRGPGPLLECRYEQIEDRPGGVSIHANGCALVIPRQAALLRLAGPKSPERLLSSIQWTGQGSLVSPDAVIAQWAQPDGRAAALDETGLSIAGLVRSEVEFAGPAEAGPPANRLVRWQVPLRSPNPPGIDPRGLSWPRGQP